MKTIRIGNGCGFWGDNIDAPRLLVEQGSLDYLTLEYLAELTMSILAAQRERAPERGYAGDFLDVIRSLIPALQAQPNLKIVTNAGGLNPESCAEKVREILIESGITDRAIGVVGGDQLLPSLDEILGAGHGLDHLDTHKPIDKVRDLLISANAYLGASGIVEALQGGASIVITGRVADASLTVGPALHEFGWRWDDWDRLAAATVAGHVIECGAQATGGLWCHWDEAPDLADVGYPIAEINEEGIIQITKPAHTGGRVNIETISEQLLYEVGDPSRYLTPDVIADFTSLRLEQVEHDVVRITGASGKAATDSYKVSAAYRDGFSASGMLVIFGPSAERKARRCGEMIFERVRRAGFELERKNIEILGAGDCVPGVVDSTGEPAEVVLRISARDFRKEAITRFTKELAPLVTSGPPGVTGYTTGRPQVREVFAYWPTLVPKDLIAPQVTILR